MKLYLIAGHNGKGTGAYSKFGDEGEETIDVRNDIAAKLRHEHGVDVITDDDLTPLRKVLIWLQGVRKSDVIVDIHFNAFNGKAHGTEVIVANEYNYREKTLAESLLNATVKSLGTKSRGVKTERLTARKRIGILSGRPKKAINVLLEVCFIDNEGDMKKYDDNYCEFIEAVAVALAEFVDER